MFAHEQKQQGQSNSDEEIERRTSKRYDLRLNYEISSDFAFCRWIDDNEFQLNFLAIIGMMTTTTTQDIVTATSVNRYDG